jgi:hypothetical protein
LDLLAINQLLTSYPISSPGGIAVRMPTPYRLLDKNVKIDKSMASWKHHDGDDGNTGRGLAGERM